MNGPNRAGEHRNCVFCAPSGEPIIAGTDEGGALAGDFFAIAQWLAWDVVKQPESDLSLPVRGRGAEQLQVEARHDIREIGGQRGRDEQIFLIIDRLVVNIRLQKEPTQATRNQRIQGLIVGWALERLVRSLEVKIVRNYGDSTIRQVRIAAPVSVTAIVKWPP